MTDREKAIALLRDLNVGFIQKGDHLFLGDDLERVSGYPDSVVVFFFDKNGKFMALGVME